MIFRAFRAYPTKRSIMKRSKAVILLGVFGSILTLCFVIAEIVIIAIVRDDYGTGAAAIVALLPALGHAVASAFAYGHFRKKHGLSAPKFVMLNALPLFLIGAVRYAAALMGIYITTTIDRGTGILLGVLYTGFLGYSAAYAALLSAVLGIKHAVGKRKRRKERL